LKQTNINDLFFPWDLSEITCEHGGLDPKTLSQTRLISAAAFDKLQQYSNPLPEIQVCRVCIEEEYNRRTAFIDRDEQIATFNALNEGERIHVIPKSWLARWKAKTPLPDLGLPTDEACTLWCTHGNRYDTTQKTILLTPGALSLLHSVVGDFPTFTSNEGLCVECAEADADKTEQTKQWESDVKEERKIWRLINPQPAFEMDYYVLPRGFCEAAKQWRDGLGEKAILGNGRCGCGAGGVDYDPGREGVDWVGEVGWKLIQEK
jgi:hypothetical protein